MDLARLGKLGRRSATQGEATSCLWVMEALAERGYAAATPAVSMAEAARATLTPAELVELHITLTGCVTPECPISARAEIIRSQLDLINDLITGGSHLSARLLLEQAVPAVASIDHVPQPVATLLIQGARIARENKWNRAILTLLDRKLRFDSAQERREANLLMGIALGSGDRALDHLRAVQTQNDQDVECHYLLGAAHATRAKKARSDTEFAGEREKSLHHLNRARQLAADTGSGFSGAVLGAASGMALLALMAPVYDEIMYLDGPLRGAQASASHSSMSE